MYGMRVTGSGVAARAGILALALAVGAGLTAAPGFAQDKKPAPAAAGKAPAKPADAKPADAKPAAAAAAPAADAKAGDPKDQNAWLKLCEKTPTIADPKKILNVCLTLHEILDNTGMPSISAAVREVEGQPKKGVLVMVPLGAFLQGGVHIKVDENEPVKLAFTLCHIGGCTAEAEATPALIEQMNKGTKIDIVAVDIAGQPKGVRVSLQGFDKAFVGAPVDNDKYKEARKNLLMSIRQRMELAKKAQQEESAAKKGEPATKKQ